MKVVFTDLETRTGPTKVQTAVNFAVELVIIDIESQRLGQGSLNLLLELPHFFSHVDGILVKHELHEVGVLQNKHLHKCEVHPGGVRRVVSLDYNIKVSVRVSAVALVCLDDPRQRVHQEGRGPKLPSIPSARSDEGDVLQFVLDHVGLGVSVSGCHPADLSVDGSVDSDSSGHVLLSECGIVVILVNYMDLDLDLIKFLEHDIVLVVNTKTNQIYHLVVGLSKVPDILV